MQNMMAAKQEQEAVRIGAAFVMAFYFFKEMPVARRWDLIKLSGVDKSILFFTEFCMFLNVS